jgi:O-acetyl-ADP-ribose deacetylase (regulator of RNase III)
MRFQFIHQGDIFNSGCQALVNPVNCQGVMGKGLAKEFKKRFPENFRSYKEACVNGWMRIGRCYVREENGTVIFNFPTKDNWRKPSEYEYIDKGMKYVAETLQMLPYITSIAIPPLGCGLGGLEWDIVGGMIEDILIEVLGNTYKLEVKVYCP